MTQLLSEAHLLLEIHVMGTSTAALTVVVLVFTLRAQTRVLARHGALQTAPVVVAEEEDFQDLKAVAVAVWVVDVPCAPTSVVAAVAAMN